jgi:pimeloyl-ACP methyl ester carboxylesterase
LSLDEHSSREEMRSADCEEQELKRAVMVTILGVALHAVSWRVLVAEENSPQSKTGLVKKVDASAGQVVVLAVRELTFAVTESTRIVQGDVARKLGDITVGATVTVAYTREGDTRTATKITIVGDLAKGEPSVKETGAAATQSSALAESDLAETVRMLGERLDQLAATAEPPLFRRHLISVNAIVRSEAARAMLDDGANPKVAGETRGYLRDLANAYAGDAAQWDTYLEGRRALVLARLSGRDGTLQFCCVHLPADWDTQMSYPLLLNLHGAGPIHPLYYVAVVARGISSNSPERAGYHVMPYGRGNSSYRDIGEIDVLECFDDVHRTFRIDDDRCYLYGFSMGGSGTWRIARRTPDRWAAIAPCGAGGPGVHPPAMLARNVTNLPVRIYIGEADRGFEGAKTLRDTIAQYGPAPAFASTPGLGHVWTDQARAECVEWLLGHTRKRPDSFTFVADTDDHLGVWGITMKRDIALSVLPEFECTISGNTVRIDSKGTAGMEANLGAGGLGLSGPVVVVWNGTKAYEGPASVIELGEGTRRRR